jgi:hypothetical protein
MNLHPEEFIRMNKQVPNAERLIAENDKLKTLSEADAKQQWAHFELDVNKVHHALGAMVDLGVRYVRTDFAWNFLQFQTKDGTIWNDTALQQFASYLKLLQDYHLEPICILYRPPQWVEKLSRTDFKERERYWMLFAQYCAKIAHSLGSYITYYQLWNEPNNKFAHANALDALIMEFYAQLMASGQLTLKNINPHAIAMINIMVNNDGDWVKHLSYYTQFITACDKDNIVKIYGIDHYPATWTANADYLNWSPVDMAVKLLQDLALESKSTAVVETGYSTTKSVVTWWGFHTEEDQENWILESINAMNEVIYKHNNRENPQKVAFLNWYECYNMTEDEKPLARDLEYPVRILEYHFGIHNANTSRKYGYDALKRTINFNARNLSAACTAGQKPGVFCRGTDGYLRYYDGNSGAWQSGFTQAGRLSGDLHACYNAYRQHPEVFFRGSNGYLNHYYYDKGWRRSEPSYFKMPVTGQAGQMKGTLSVVLDEVNRHPEVFLKVNDGYLYRFHVTAPYTAQASWVCENVSQQLGGRVRGSIAAFFNGNAACKHTEVFFKGEDSHLHYLYFDGTQWRWGGEWFYEAGEVLGDIAAVYNPALNSPEVFFRNGWGILSHYAIHNGQWTANPALGLHTLKLPVLGQIAAVYNPAQQHTEALYKGGDGRLHCLYFANNAWHDDGASFQQGGLVEGGIAAHCTTESGQTVVHVLYRDRENNVRWHQKQNDTWQEKARVAVD